MKSPASRRLVVFLLLSCSIIALTRGCASTPPPAPAPFTGIAPIERDNLELHFRSLDSRQSTSLKDGTSQRTVALNAYVRAPDGGVDFTTERSIRLTEVRDDQGRDLLAISKAAAAAKPKIRADDDSPFDFYRFTRPGYAWDSTRGYSCSVYAHLNGITGPVSRLAVVKGEVHALRIAETRVFDVPLPGPDDPQRHTLRELTPGLWFSFDEALARQRRATIAYRYWLCNDVAPQYAGKPTTGKRRNINEFLGVIEQPSYPGFTGRDPRRPPFLLQVEIVDAAGKVLDTLDFGTVEVRLPSGVYGEFNDLVTLAVPGEPVAARVTVITAVNPVTIPLELRDLPLEGPALESRPQTGEPAAPAPAPAQSAPRD